MGTKKDSAKITDSVTATKEDNVERTKKPTTKKNIIWLYGAHPRLVQQAAFRISNFGSPESIKIKEQLGLSLSTPVVFVYPFPPQSRVALLQEIGELKEATIIVLGLPIDLDNKKLKSYYKEAKIAWVHPPERQFHIDMAPESISITFTEAEQRLQEAAKYFKDLGERLQIVRG